MIDVFDAARPISREEAGRRVKQATDRELTDEDLAPMTKRAIIARMLNNLLGVSTRDAQAMNRYLSALIAIDAPGAAQHRLMRASARYWLEQREAAREDLDWVLEHGPPGVDLDRVRQLQQELERAGR